MSLTLALNNALSGLAVNQKALATISQNIANANTVGYTRKTIDQSSLVINNGVGSGVQIDGISRKVDEYLSRAVRAGNGSSARAETVNDYMERLQIYLGEPGQANSLDSHVQTFFSALQSLAETPESTSFKAQSVSTADQLARDVSDLAGQMEGLRFQADQDIASGITGFNATLKKLSVVNTAIQQANVYGQPNADLLDKRDVLLNDVSSFMDAKIVYQSDGEAFVYAKSGQPLLAEERYQLEYSATGSPNDLIADVSFNNILVRRINQNGTLAGDASVLTKGGTAGKTDNSGVGNGKLDGLLTLRDKTLPGFLDELDQMASTIRDSMNAIHNLGSGYPGSKSYQAERALLPTDYTGYQGQVQIGLLSPNGTPLPSLYADEKGTGMRPLTLDLGSLDSGYGPGKPTLQSIADEINYYYGTPQNKVSVGNLNQIQMAAISNNIPGSPASFSFDFDAENISGTAGKFFVTDVAVADDTGTDITNVTSTQPQFALDPAATYTTTANSAVVRVTTAGPQKLNEGDTIFLGDPGAGPFNGLSGSQLTGYFKISNVGPNGFDIVTQGVATGAGAVGVAGVTAMPSYDTLQTGEHRRTGANGVLTANLAGNDSSQYYDFTVSFGVVAPDGTVSSGTATYRVLRDQNILNQRFSGSSVTGNAKLQSPATNQALLRATLVDENGIEIPQLNGKFADTKGYLKIQSLTDGAYVAFSDVNSREVGAAGIKAGSQQGFFQYMGLNNFFTANAPVDTGDAVKHSALNLAVEQRLIDEPGLLTTGQLTRSSQSTNPNDPPVYSYERFKGDNSLAQKLAGIANQTQHFNQAGGLSETNMTLTSYAGEMIGYMAAQTNNAASDYKDQQTLVDGLKTRADSVSGVNLDEELANTIIYQNAYTASARIISVTKDLFDSLLSTFQ